MTSRWRFISEHRAEFGVQRAGSCERVGRGSTSGGPASRPAPSGPPPNSLADEIAEIHREHRGCYGSPRVAVELRRRGRRVNRKRVERIMRHRGIVGVTRRRRRNMVLVEWNDTAADLPADQVVPDLLASAVRQDPRQVALRWADGSMTYADLNARANRLAWRLQEHGAGPDTVIGIYMRRSPEMIVAVLAVLKAGAAYLPLRSAFPDARYFLLADTNAHPWHESTGQLPIFSLQFELVHALMDVPIRPREFYKDAFAGAGLRIERCEPLGGPSTWLYLLSVPAKPERLSRPSMVS